MLIISSKLSSEEGYRVHRLTDSYEPLVITDTNNSFTTFLEIPENFTPNENNISTNWSLLTEPCITVEECQGTATFMICGVERTCPVTLQRTDCTMAVNYIISMELQGGSQDNSVCISTSGTQIVRQTIFTTLDAERISALNNYINNMSLEVVSVNKQDKLYMINSEFVID